MKNDVWDVVPRPEEKLFVTSKRIYKIKHAVDGRIEKYKTRFVAQGFSQKEGIDYEETFSPIAKYTSIRSVLALAAMMKWNIHIRGNLVSKVGLVIKCANNKFCEFEFKNQYNFNKMSQP